MVRVVQVLRRVAVPVVLSAAMIVPPAGTGWPAGRAGAAGGAGQAPAPTVAADETSASALARRSGQRIEVASARTELTQIFAEPSGGFVMESAVVPQRTRRADGTWADLDLNLGRGGDGLWRPAASTADVRFSNGGTGPLVTLVRDGGTFTLSWAGALPPPVVTAEAATYPEVIAGVDLVVQATPTGFTHVLVVKTPQAAASPAVRQVRFSVGGSVRLRALADGGLQAVAGDGVPLASAPPPVMWDSSAAADSPAAQEGAGSTGRSSAAAPGDGAATAPIGVEVSSNGQLVLRPDVGLLRSGSPTYPVYVDPAWSTGRSRWAYASNDNRTNETSVARVGKSPRTGQLYRSYFEFPMAAIGGKFVRSAYVQMKVDHTWSCGNTVTHMYQTSTIASTPRTKWRPSNTAWLAAAESHANEAGGCGEIQDDMTVNFQHSNVTSTIRRGAKGKWPHVTIGFCACNANGEYESNQDRWKKYFPGNAKLIVDYSSYPGKPHSLQVAGVACPATGRTTVGSLTPTLSGVYPDADTTQALRTTIEWLEIPASGTYDDATPRKPAPAGASVPAGGRSTTAPLPTLQQGKAYAFRLKATDPAPYNLPSEPSAWCEFVPDTLIPPVTVTPTSLPDGPGKPATFTLSSTDSSVTKFRYGWVGPPVTEIAVTWTGAKSVPLTLTVPAYGKNILYVQAIDAAGNVGNGSTEFITGRPSPAVARWGLETYGGVDQAAALADRQPALAGDTPLTPATGVTWSKDIRLVGGRTATLNATAASHLTATGPVIDTTQSYSVAAWVRLNSATDCTGNQTIASVDGVQASAFYLTYNCGLGGWRMRVTDRDQADASVWSAEAPVALGVWTHVAGSWDAGEQRILLYLNGVRVHSMKPSAAWLSSYGSGWRATGPLVIGRDLWNGRRGGQIAAEVADVQVFDRVLVPHDFTGQASSDPYSGGVNQPGVLDPILVNSWDFNSAVPCYAPAAEVGLCEAPANAGSFPRRLALTHGSGVGTGNRGPGLLLDDVHYTDDPDDPYFGLRTFQYGRSQNLAGPATAPVGQDAPVLRTDHSFSVSAWLRPDPLTHTMTAVGQQGVKQSAFFLSAREHIVDGVERHRWQFTVSGQDDGAQAARVHAEMTSRWIDSDDIGTWTHVVGVYDAQAGRIQLYVNGELEASTPCPRVMFSSGALTVGAALFSTATEAPHLVDAWEGGIDDLGVYQGALTEAAVTKLFAEQSAEGQSNGS